MTGGPVICSARPAATSPPACPAASPTSTTSTATSRQRLNREMVNLYRADRVRRRGDRRASRPRSSATSNSPAASRGQVHPRRLGRRAAEVPQGHARATTSACSNASRKAEEQGLAGDEAIHGRLRGKRSRTCPASRTEATDDSGSQTLTPTLQISNSQISTSPWANQPDSSKSNAQTDSRTVRRSSGSRTGRRFKIHRR